MLSGQAPSEQSIGRIALAGTAPKAAGSVRILEGPGDLTVGDTDEAPVLSPMATFAQILGPVRQRVEDIPDDADQHPSTLLPWPIFALVVGMKPEMVTKRAQASTGL